MQLGFKAVNPSSSYMAHEVNQIWNWIKIKSKPNFFRVWEAVKSRSATKAGKSCGKLEKSEDGGVGSSQRRSVAILKQKAADVDLQQFIIFTLHLHF